MAEKKGAGQVELSAKNLHAINEASARIPVEGNRYPEHLEKMTNR